MSLKLKNLEAKLELTSKCINLSRKTIENKKENGTFPCFPNNNVIHIHIHVVKNNHNYKPLNLWLKMP